MRLLQMMVLPLIAGSMISGVCSLSASGAQSGKLARMTLAYYAGTTVIAVVLGIILVNVVQPGVGHGFDSGGSLNSTDWRCAGHKGEVEKHIPNRPADYTTADSLLDVLRSMFPPNIVKAAADMNILGVITFSLFFGSVLSGLGTQGETMMSLVDVFNEIIMRMVNAVLWISPVGIASLIASKIAGSCDPAAMVSSLGLFIFNILFGLTIHAAVVLPLCYFIATRKNPLKYISNFIEAFVTAFGTDSSTATLPVTMKCAIEKAKLDEDIVRFVAPLGATVNMNGTALYEASTVIFLAQVNNHPLDMADTFVIAFTATLAAVGAAAIPSAGLVTMVMVLQAVGMEEYIKDIAFVLAIDWFLDRFRTVVNVMGDSFGCGVVAHFAEDGSLSADGQAFTPRRNRASSFQQHVNLELDDVGAATSSLDKAPVPPGSNTDNL